MVRFLFFGSKRPLEPPYLTPSRGSLGREWFGFCSSDRSVYWNLRTSPQVGAPLTGNGSVFVLRIEASTGTSVPHPESGLPWQGVVRFLFFGSERLLEPPHLTPSRGLTLTGNGSDRSVSWNLRTSPQVGAPLTGDGSVFVLRIEASPGTSVRHPKSGLPWQGVVRFWFFGSKRLLEPPYLTPSRGSLGREWFEIRRRVHRGNPDLIFDENLQGVPHISQRFLLGDVGGMLPALRSQKNAEIAQVVVGRTGH